MRDEFFFLGVNVYEEDFAIDGWMNNADRLERAVAQGSHSDVLAYFRSVFPARLQTTLDAFATLFVPS